MKRQLIAIATLGLLMTGIGAATAPAQTRHHAHEVDIVGTVATPLSYTAADVSALPQVTLPDLRTRRSDDTVTGALLAPLITMSSPVLPSVKNAALRVTLNVLGDRHHAIAFTLAELTPANGNHPALLVARQQHRHASVDLVFPGDRGHSRTVRDVSRVEVGVAAPTVPSGVPVGGVRVGDGRRTVTLTAAKLAELPSVTRAVTFQSGSGPQQHIETGPTLARVLRAAGVRTNPTTTVAAVADDGYVATVTPAEATVGRRVLLLATVEDGAALAHPRLVTDGDVSGGRYVSGVLALQVRSSCQR